MRSKRKRGKTISLVVQGKQTHKKKKNSQSQQSHCYRCKQCNRAFNSSTALGQHRASPAHSRRDMPCPCCNKIFKTTSGIAQHLESKCFRRITETIIKWDVAHQITRPVYTDRIQEIKSDAEAELQVVPRIGIGNPHVPNIVVSHLLNPGAWNPMNFRCPNCWSYFSLVSSLIQHIESGKCGLAKFQEVKQIYTGMHDMFKRLIKN